MVEVGKMKIKDWERIFSDLYSEADSKRTPEQMWVAIMAHTSQIGESLRKGAFESLLNYAAHTFCWLCSFINKCNTLADDVFSIKESLCEIVCLKYPSVCGHCRHKPCACDPVTMEKERNKSAEYKTLLDDRRQVLRSWQDYSIDDCKKQFYAIYGARGHIQTFESIGFHFLEEIGEAAVSVRKLSQLRGIAQDTSTKIDSAFLDQLSTVEGVVKNYAKYYKMVKEIDYVSRDPTILRARLVEAKMSLLVEIGDSFSWFCAILNKLDSILKSIHDDPEKSPRILKPLEQILNEEYIDSTGKARCPSCKSNPCKCVFYSLACGN